MEPTIDQIADALESQITDPPPDLIETLGDLVEYGPVGGDSVTSSDSVVRAASLTLKIALSNTDYDIREAALHTFVICCERVPRPSAFDLVRLCRGFGGTIVIELDNPAEARSTPEPNALRAEADSVGTLLPPEAVLPVRSPAVVCGGGPLRMLPSHPGILPIPRRPEIFSASKSVHGW